MCRSGTLLVTSVLLILSGLANADAISPTAEFIKTRPYLELSSENWQPLNADNPAIDGPEDIEKASGIVPSVGHGRVVWADGRAGNVVIMGHDLINFAAGEFLISKGNPLTDDWQEGNPFVGMDSVGVRHTVYDADQVGVRLIVHGPELGVVQKSVDLRELTCVYAEQTGGRSVT